MKILFAVRKPIEGIGNVTPIDQNKFYQPEAGEDGNCFQAAVASVFDLNLDDVPNFMDNKDTFLERYAKFVRDRGYSIISLGLETARDLDAYYLAMGPSARGCGHVVVYYRGKLVHDPHPARTGLISVDFVHVFVPRELSTASR
jgi:hypothetical protein